MPLDFNSPLFEDQIYFVKKLSQEHPVFLLNGYEGDRLVIKSEDGNITAQDVKFNTKFMGAVDRNAKAKVLLPSELAALKTWIDLYSFDPDSGASVLADGFGRGGIWTKMQALNVMVLSNAVERKPGRSDKTDVRFIAKTLNDPGGLEKLGEIVAADLFNGNRDRFWPFDGGRTWNGKTLKCLVNVGNVFVTVDPAQKGSVSGLDSFDPWSEWKNQSGPLTNSGQWGGKLLADNERGARMIFAQKIVDDLNFVLGPRSRKILFANKKRLTGNAATRVNTGIESGASKIRQRISQYLGKNKQWPQGLEDRFAALGWFAKVR